VKFVEGLRNNVNLVCKECGIEAVPEKLKEFIEKEGIVQFLKTHSTYDLFKVYAGALNLYEDQEPSVSGLEEILDEIVLQGMRSWIVKFPKPLLEAWCAELSIEVTSRSDLVDRIMTKVFSLQQLEDDVNISLIPISSHPESGDKKDKHSEKKTPSKIKPDEDSVEKKSKKKQHSPQHHTKRKLEDSDEGKKDKSKKRRSKEETSDESDSDDRHDRHSKKRKDDDGGDSSKKSKSLRVKKSPAFSQIKRGITGTELSRFKRIDLVSFCKENSISYAGKKEMIFKRILHHFNGSEESDDDEEEEKDEKEEKTHSSKKK